MSVLVRIDNVTYQAVGPSILAAGVNQVLLTNRVISPTQIKFIIEAGHMQINYTFLNPIEVRTRITRHCHTIYSCLRYSLKIGSSNQSHSHTCH